MSGQGTEIKFHETDDASPIVIGMGVKMYTVTNNMTIPPSIVILRTGYRESRLLETYMHKGDPYKLQIRFLVAPVLNVVGLLGEARRPTGLRPVTLAKLMHNATHAHP